MIVRRCEGRDLAALERQIPSPGRNRFHDARYARQQQGRSAFLIAVDGAVPVGSGEILWDGCSAPEVRRRFPGCPEVSGLTVAAERRSQGIGTALIRAAEDLVAQRGHHRVGLGVDDDNPRAAALYLRLGYRDTGCHYLDRYPYLDAGGVAHEAADPCRFLIKEI